MTVRELLLLRQGLVDVPSGPPGRERQPDRLLHAVEMNLGELGYALSTRLRERLAALPIDALTATQDGLYKTLAAGLGADRKHVPLFRKFPRDVPDDTFSLYMKKVLLYFCQAEGQPCLFCRRMGTTHVLSPCGHVVCDRCFDGANYSACPACERHVDPGAPFFRPAAEVDSTTKVVNRPRFKLLDLCADADAAARDLFVSLCARRQALSPADNDALLCIVGAYRERVLPWVPETIPLKENIATLFGTLLRQLPADAILPHARRHLATATDVLRLIAVYCGASAALQGEARFIAIGAASSVRFRTALDKRRRLAAGTPGATPAWLQMMERQPIAVTVHRFKMVPLGRPLRRALLAILDGLPFERLAEDMLRHRAYWVGVGERLHPFEYAARFPNAALGFAVVRGTRDAKEPLGARLGAAAAAAPLDRTPKGAYRFRGFYHRLEAAGRARDSRRFTRILSERPGELGRRIDHALRLALASGEPAAVAEAGEALSHRVGQLSTPLLLTLHGVLPRRDRPAPARLFWPKGQVAKGVSRPDVRPSLPPELTGPLDAQVVAELLRRFAAKPHLPAALIDGALRDVIVPFKERTASRSAVVLPRGSTVALPDAGDGKLLRLFLHWCQPERATGDTDIDLSIGFYDAAWRHVGVCSYYQLKWSGRDGREIARSSGDLRDAPFPDGASEFVDLDPAAARAEGARYAVMVVNNYAGLPFALLERAFAGLMLRDAAEGLHFDPQAVALKFDLSGDNGIYLPLVVDLDRHVLHWLDVYSSGELALNNVQTSNRAIQKMCPELLAYFASGVRPSMYELALLHAAARCQTVLVRGAGLARFVRHDGEDALAFYRRLAAHDPTQVADAALPAVPAAVVSALKHTPVLAALLRGDLALGPGSSCYALFREGQTAVIAAADLLG